MDVFAEQRYQGNQLAVVLDSEGLSSREMLDITREMNYSETSFVISPDRAEVRIFTPIEEVPFAGHPTLGTAFILQQEVIRENIATLHIRLPAGIIPVTFSYREGAPDKIWMRQLEPVFGSTVDPVSMAELLGLSPADIDPDFPVQEVSTGLPFIIVPLRSLAACKRCAPFGPALLKFVAGYEAKNILVFTTETYSPENQLNVRVFTDYLGIPEDPATGSVNGCLAGYLTKYRYFGTDFLAARVEQGYEINRRSLLFMNTRTREHKIEIDIGGSVIPVASGTLI